MRTQGTDDGSVVIFHDYFAIRGGGERLVLDLARGLSAAVCFGFRTPDTYPLGDFPEVARDLALPPGLRRNGIRPLALARAFRRQRGAASRASVRIYSGSAAPFAVPAAGADGLDILYCHTPPRFLYDQRARFVGRVPSLLRGPAAAMMWWFARGYGRAVRRMDVVVANSENTRRRIERYLGCDSVVVHPPVDLARFRYAGDGGYFLSTARLAPLKRVDAIVTAFKAMPDKQLVVASGGEELGRLRQLADGAPNITFSGWVDEEALTDLVRNATATIYLPVDEDFGMSPVESMAAGKPVIGVAEGGLLETVVDGETGVLLPPRFDTASIVGAVRAMTPERAAAMRSACEERARLFSRDRFLEGMREVIATALADKSR